MLLTVFGMRSDAVERSMLIIILMWTFVVTTTCQGHQQHQQQQPQQHQVVELHLSNIPPTADSNKDTQENHQGLFDYQHRVKRATAATYKAKVKEGCKKYRSLVSTSGELHSACLMPNPSCDIYNSSVTPEERQAILKLHNQLRSKVAMGKEESGNPGPQPPAILMNQLTWDNELADIARMWAMQCIDAQHIDEPMPKNPHDCTECRKVLQHDWPFVGQNVAWSATWSSDGSMKLQSQWPKHIQGWYDEVKDFSRFEALLFKGDQPGGPMIAHYTQVVWGATSKIGCGAAYYSCNIKNSRDGKLYGAQCLKYVCNYGTGGNLRGLKLYEQPCNKTSPDFPGLCKTEL